MKVPNVHCEETRLIIKYWIADFQLFAMKRKCLRHGCSLDLFVGTLFENFEIKSLKKMAKMHYVSIFVKSFNKPRVKFLRVWRKNANCWEILENFENFWWKLYRKMEFFFYFYFGKFVTKISAFGNNTLLRFRGDSLFSPGYALGLR